MLTALSTILGFITGIIPRLIAFYEQKEKYKYELEIAKLRASTVTANQGNLELEREIQRLKTEAITNESLYGLDDTSTDSSFVSNLRASVRPVITYTFFLFFVLAKLIIGISMAYQGIPLATVSATMLDELTLGIFGSIIGFWFGARGSAAVIVNKSVIPLPRKQ